MRSSYCISLLLTYNLTMQPENLDSLGAIRNRFQIVDRQTDLGTVLLVNLFIRRHESQQRLQYRRDTHLIFSSNNIAMVCLRRDLLGPR